MSNSRFYFGLLRPLVNLLSLVICMYNNGDSKDLLSFIRRFDAFVSRSQSRYRRFLAVDSDKVTSSVDSSEPSPEDDLPF